MWCMRRLLKIKWISRVSNEEVLNRMGTRRNSIRIIRKQKLSYLGHIMRSERYYTPQITLEGKIMGKRLRGARRKGWMDDMKDGLGLDTEEIIHETKDRELWFMLAANLPMG